MLFFALAKATLDAFGPLYIHNLPTLYGQCLAVSSSWYIKPPSAVLSLSLSPIFYALTNLCPTRYLRLSIEY